MKDAPVLHRLEYAVWLPLRWLITALPIGLVRALGRTLGRLSFFLLRKRRRIAEANVGRALPELSPERQREIARHSAQAFGESMFDGLAATRYDARALCQRLSLEGWENLHTARAAGKGMIIASAHLGSWEVAAWTLGLSAMPMTVVGRHPDNPWLLRDMLQLRERFGNTMVGRRRVGLRLYRRLIAGEAVGIMIDQRVHPDEGVEVELFGHRTWASPLAAYLSLRTGAPLVGIYAIAQPGGRWCVWTSKPIFPVGDYKSEDDQARLTRQYLRQVVETEVRRNPGRWLWMHDRWRDQRPS